MGTDLNVKEQPVSETDDAQSTRVGTRGEGQGTTQQRRGQETEDDQETQSSKGEGRRQRVQGMIRRPRGETL